MEVVALSGNSNNAPFKREVHEWQHIDTKTGALLSGRAEANRYVNGNVNSYGKVSYLLSKLLFLKLLICELKLFLLGITFHSCANLLNVP